MLKRAAAGFLWFGMVWVGYEIVWSIFGVPRLLGPAAAALVALIVILDPLHVFWAHRDATARLSVVDPNVQTVTSDRANSH